MIGGTTDGGGDGGEEGEGVREGEESVVGVATRSEVSRYYSKPPDSVCDMIIIARAPVTIRYIHPLIHTCECGYFTKTLSHFMKRLETSVVLVRAVHTLYILRNDLVMGNNTVSRTFRL